jgi:hypothetical protein
MKDHPPFLLHLVAFAFLLAAAVQVFGILQLVRTWNWLQVTGYSPSPLVIVFKGVFFALAYLLSAVFLWMRLTLAPGFGGAAFLLGTAWFWVDRVLLTSNPLPIKEHLFLLLANFILLGLGLASLYLLVPYMKTIDYDEEDTGD